MMMILVSRCSLQFAGDEEAMVEDVDVDMNRVCMFWSSTFASPRDLPKYPPFFFAGSGDDLLLSDSLPKRFTRTRGNV